MRNEKVVYTCDDCGCEVKDGFVMVGGICSLKNDVTEKIIDLTGSDEGHYCKPCFKAKLGLKERARKATDIDE